MTKADKEGRRKAPILRFKGFTDDWEQRQLNEVTTRVLRKNKNLTSKRPLTISSQYGLIDQQAFFNKQVASSNLENYLLLEKGEFAYNKSYSDGFPYGTIKKLNLYENGAVSTLYIAFKANADINSDFLENLFSSNKWNNEVYKIAAEGARNHGLLNISPNDFFNIKITISKDSQEQAFISKFLRVFDNLLALYERKLKLLSQVKKYFLDNLFAEKEYPNLRLKGFTDAWEQRKLNDIAKVYDGIHETPNYTTYGIPFASVENIRTLATKKYVSKNFYEEKFKIKPQYNDILMTRIGDIGTSNVVSKVPLAYYVSLALIRLNADQNAHFFKYYFDSEYAQKELWSRTLHIAFPKKINKNEIGKINVYTTSIKEENKISQLFNKLNYLLTLYENKQQHLNEIKKTLLNTMFI